MRGLNLKSVATQYGMRQARIEARRGRKRKVVYNPQPINVNNDNNNRIIIIFLFISFIIIVARILS
jgi:hypothetical protein